jgi:hypothetical protein
MDFIKWFKSKNIGFVRDSQIHEELRPSLNYYLAHTNKIGVFVSKLYDENGDLSRLEFGYYVRSRNPFKWQFHSTHGNYGL